MEVATTARECGAFGQVARVLPEGLHNIGATPPVSAVWALGRTLMGEERFAYDAAAPASEGRYASPGALGYLNGGVEIVGGKVSPRGEPGPTTSAADTLVPEATPTPTPMPEHQSGDGGVSLWLIILLVLVIPLVSVVASYVQRESSR